MNKSNNIIIMTSIQEKIVVNNNNIITVGLNNTACHINITYDNFCFQLDKYIIYENINQFDYLNNINLLDNTNYLNYTIINNIITIPYFNLNIYLKIAYILNIIGYNTISIYKLKIIDPNLFYNNQIYPKSISIFNILDIYSSYSFYNYIEQSKLNFFLIQDDLSLYNRLNRITLSNYSNDQTKIIIHDRDLYKYIFESCDGRQFINQYIKIINKDIIDDNFLIKYNKYFILPDPVFPNNEFSYKYLYNKYKFSSYIYLIYLDDIKYQSYDDFNLFLHFLKYEQDKFIFNFPENFNYNKLLEFNPDLLDLGSPKRILLHFLKFIYIDHRKIYDISFDLDYKLYEQLNNLTFNDKYQAEHHYLTIGQKNNLLTNEYLPINFDPIDYIKSNPNIKFVNELDAIKKYIISVRDISKITNIINYNDQTTSKKILGICHIGNIEIFKKMELYINNLLSIQSEKYTVQLYINIVDTISTNDINYIKNKYPNIIILINKNIGFDIASLFYVLKECKENNLEFDYIIKIHTKTSDNDREHLIKPILGSSEQIHNILNLFQDNTIGLIGSLKKKFYNDNNIALHNKNHLQDLFKKYNMNLSACKVVQFIGGTMFWIRFDILKKIFLSYDFNDIISELNHDESLDWNWYKYANKELIKDYYKLNTKEKASNHYLLTGKKRNLSPNLFHAIKYNTKTKRLRDGMIEHAYERFFSYYVEYLNFKQLFI